MKYFKFCTLLLALAAGFTLFSMGSFAKSPAPRLVDEADVLTEAQESELRAQLDRLSERLQFDFLILAVEDTDGKDILDYADDYHRSYGFREDAASLVIDLSGREWCVATYGEGNRAISNDATYEYLQDFFLSDLSAGNYSKAFKGYLKGAEKLVYEAQQGNLYEDWVIIPWGRNALIAVVVGAIIALVVVFSMRSKLNSVAFKGNAAGYVREGSFKLTRDRDLFLYRTHMRTYSPQQKSSGGSSGGGSRGGGRGRF